MEMKKVLFAALLIGSVTTVFAQGNINKGNWMVGGNAGFDAQSHGDDDDNKMTSFNISPNAGYFFINNLAGGLRLNLESSKVKSDEDATTGFSVAPFLRYYFLPSTQKVNIFADGSYGIGSVNSGDDGVSFNQFGIMAGPAVFLTPNTALEFGLYYKSVGGDLIEAGFGDDKRTNNFGINIGFQIHLGSKK